MEAAVKSFKTHLTRVVNNCKLDFKEMSTLLAQIEACCPLGTIPHNDGDGINMLTLGHFIIGHPLQAIPDILIHPSPLAFLEGGTRLCYSLVRHFWKRWRNEYIIALRSYLKMETSQVGDVIIVKDDN